jgi:vanillate O-demethylase ferredoxin subunit
VSQPTRRVRVARKTVEAQGICSLVLVDAEGGALPPFTAGSHIDVQLGDGLVRQYSLCNRPGAADHYQIAVLLEAASRGGSAAVHAVQEGQVLRISDPKNLFALAPDAPHSLLLAGGIDRLQASAFAQRVSCHFDDGAAGQKLDIAAVLQAAAAGTHLYVCGPAGFMDWVLAAGRAAGWPEARLHREYFAAAPIDTRADGSFEVQLASSGTVIRVAADQSVVQALAAHGVQVDTSCEQGVCGTCLTKVLDGTPEHRDMFLTPAEQARCDQFLPCCSRSQSARLVLDL